MLVKSAAAKEPQLESCPYTDIFPYIDEAILNHWNQKWRQETSNKLREVIGDAFEWKEAKEITRRESVILNRLRTGHTNLTHSCLMEGSRVPPACELCGIQTMTIRHLFTQ